MQTKAFNKTSPKLYTNPTHAIADLRDEGYHFDHKRVVWTSEDGLVDAEVRQGPAGWYVVHTA